MLWTRLAPEPPAGDGHGGMPRPPYTVAYEAAEDEGFRRIAARGHALATSRRSAARTGPASSVRPRPSPPRSADVW
ncbi:hypothetical protein [Virgisporangium aurantiacum]|uniref:hypothetical protein n=1 Tax=Virgisporangium aurantiacum TaxID=175570 RepID=UPI003570BB90